MDYTLLVPIITIGGVIFAIVSNYMNIQKTQREVREKDTQSAKIAGAKEEQDKNRDRRIEHIEGKLMEMEDVKRESMEIKHSVDLMSQKQDAFNSKLMEKIDSMTLALHDHIKGGK